MERKYGLKLDKYIKKLRSAAKAARRRSIIERPSSDEDRSLRAASKVRIISLLSPLNSACTKVLDPHRVAIYKSSSISVARQFIWGPLILLRPVLALETRTDQCIEYFVLSFSSLLFLNRLTLLPFCICVLFLLSFSSSILPEHN